MTRPGFQPQQHTFREAWLAGATEHMRTLFSSAGHPLPEKIYFAVAFPSTGMRGARIGEHWSADSTPDNAHTIIIRADIADPLFMLGVLAHELAHAAAPPEAKHGPKFRKVMDAVGLEGKAIHAAPGPVLTEYLKTLIGIIGPLPHSKLNFSSSGRKKVQGGKTQKCVCEDCGYEARVPLQCIEVSGPPLCPVDNEPLTPGGKFDVGE